MIRKLATIKQMKITETLIETKIIMKMENIKNKKLI